MQRMFLLLLLAGCSSGVPESLKPPANEALKRVFTAKGVQIYECRDEKWVFVAPEADLFDPHGKYVGRHYAGPHWEASGDGSRIVGTVRSRAEAPVAGAVPWLLLSTRSVAGKGYFSDVTSVQRIWTAGGAAPAGTCAGDGAQARIPYTAAYYFYKPRS